MEISVSLEFPRETCPFPLNFHPRTVGKFWYFLLCFSLATLNQSPFFRRLREEHVEFGEEVTQVL